MLLNRWIDYYLLRIVKYVFATVLLKYEEFSRLNLNSSCHGIPKRFLRLEKIDSLFYAFSDHTYAAAPYSTRIFAQISWQIANLIPQKSQTLPTHQQKQIIFKLSTTIR